MSFIAREEKSMPSFKASKDRLTLDRGYCSWWLLSWSQCSLTIPKFLESLRTMLNLLWLCCINGTTKSEQQHKKRKQNYKPSRVQILPSKKISDWVLFNFKSCQHAHCKSRFLDVHNVFVLCHFTLIFGTQVSCLDWNSLLKFILIHLRYPASIFLLFWIMYLHSGKFTLCTKK